MPSTKRARENAFNKFFIFRIWRWMAFIGVKSTAIQNLIVSVLMLFAILAVGYLDGTFFLHGTDIGLVEHPTIWIFLLLQATIPFFIQQSISKLYDFENWVSPWLSDENAKQASKKYKNYFIQFIRFKTSFSKFTFAVFTLLGLIAFTWNSYQNQLPYKFLGFDFWDSYNHVFGFWFTRIYKFYLWVLLLPALAQLQIAVLITIQKLLKETLNSDKLAFRPFYTKNAKLHTKAIEVVMLPLLPVTLITFGLLLGAAYIHQELDFTVIIGMILTSALFVLFYLIPATLLRRIIVIQKKTQIKKIAEQQYQLLNDVVKLTNSDNAKNIETKVSTIDKLQNLADQINSIPNWPYLRSVVNFITVINSPILLKLLIYFLQPLINSQV